MNSYTSTGPQYTFTTIHKIVVKLKACNVLDVYKAMKKQNVRNTANFQTIGPEP